MDYWLMDLVRIDPANANDNMSIVSVIDEIHKTSYIQCILNATSDLSCIITIITSDIQSINDDVNNVKVLTDAKITAEKVLSHFNSIEEKIKKARSNFFNIYHVWLQDYQKVNVTSTENRIPIIQIPDDNHCDNINIKNHQISEIDEIEISSSSDLEIVNEIKYFNSNSINTFNEDEYINQIKDKTLEIQSFSEEEKEATESTFVKDSKNESLKNSVNNLSPSNPLKRKANTDYLLDKKLQSKCIVLLKRLLDEPVNKETTNFVHTKKLLEDKEFSKLINLNIFKKKDNKRNELPSDYSSEDYSNDIDKPRKHSKMKKKKHERLKLTLSNDETDSNDDTSSSDSYVRTSTELLSTDADSDYDISDINKCNTDEEILKQKLLDSDDSSDNSDTDSENDSPAKERHENQRKRKLENNSSSDSSSSTRKEKSFKKSKWLNDNLLNFKLFNSNGCKKEIMKEGIMGTKEMSELNLTKNYHKSDKNKINSPSANSLECQSISSIDSSFSDSDLSVNSEMENLETIESIEDCIGINEHEVTNYDGALNTSKSKQTGRRNIRKLFDDEEITENTKLAVKNEEDRLHRLTERKNQLLLLKESKEEEEGKLVLDFDTETNKELVTVDKELVKFLKPHQEEGIRFMWDSCFESVKISSSTKGSGCILAHCMGLGKTFQIVTLSHTLLANKIVGVNTIMVVCPMNTVCNWLDEFDMWLTNVKTKIRVFEIFRNKKMSKRLEQLELWHKYGGVLIISYETLRLAVSREKKLTPLQNQQMQSYLLNPGADLVVCDEGHLLKNEDSLLANTMQKVKTKRRIILTGTPLQNNLSEYHCMVQFVKQNLLGTKVEFQNRFGNPITNGQFDNSTPQDVKLMKHRAHVLHRMLEGCVQRCDYAVLKPFLPPKQEYVILIHLSELQKEMYQYYINNVARIDDKHCRLFKIYHEIKRLVAHPMTMQLKFKDKKNLNNNMSQFNNNVPLPEFWWTSFLKDIHLDNLHLSNKLIILFGILERSEKEENKILIFSQCLHTLDVIEHFLKKLDSTKGLNGNSVDSQEWKKGLDYFRLDGKCSSSKRNVYCKTFNDPTNKRARLFLISTKAGGLGINLTGANRVVIFDPSWNPSNDVQSIFRVFRFGQEKPCYIYRFLTAGTMEQKIYNRQVTKLSLSLRVLDEQQIERHYRDNELAELYNLEPLADASPINLPKDRILADLYLKYKEYIHDIFEHDSLLENKEEEELDEDERIQAWLEYQQEKSEKPNVDVGNKLKGKINIKKRTMENNLNCQINQEDSQQ